MARLAKKYVLLYIYDITMITPEELAIKKYNSKRPIRARNLLCHAPFSSMNFTQNGDMLACCYNHKEILGTYPQQSIKDAWEGKMAQELRGYMKKKMLGNGCQACSEQILSGNYTGSKAFYYDKYAPLFNPFPMKVRPPKVFEFEISNTCNLECIMCTGYFSSAIRANREKLPKINSPYDDAFIQDVKNYIPYLTDAKFLGGEPFLISQYYEIWDAIITINPNVQVHITTNGTVLNKRAKESLEKMKAGIIISVDSLNKDNYEKIRVNGDYATLMENIRWFMDYRDRKGLYLSFAICPMISNQEYLAEIVKFCDQNKIFIHFNTVWKPNEECLRNSSEKDLARLIDELSKISHGDSYIQKINQERTTDLVAHLKTWLLEQQASTEKQMQLTHIVKTLSDSDPGDRLGKHALRFFTKTVTYYTMWQQQEHAYVPLGNRLGEALAEMTNEMTDDEFFMAWQEFILYAAEVTMPPNDYETIRLNVERIPHLSESFDKRGVNKKIVENFNILNTLKGLKDSTPEILKENIKPIL